MADRASTFFCIHFRIGEAIGIIFRRIDLNFSLIALILGQGRKTIVLKQLCVKRGDCVVKRSEI